MDDSPELGSVKITHKGVRSVERESTKAAEARQRGEQCARNEQKRREEAAAIASGVLIPPRPGGALPSSGELGEHIADQVAAAIPHSGAITIINPFTGHWPRTGGRVKSIASIGPYCRTPEGRAAAVDVQFLEHACKIAAARADQMRRSTLAVWARLRSAVDAHIKAQARCQLREDVLKGSMSAETIVALHDADSPVPVLPSLAAPLEAWEQIIGEIELVRALAEEFRSYPPFERYGERIPYPKRFIQQLDEADGEIREEFRRRQEQIRVLRDPGALKSLLAQPHDYQARRDTKAASRLFRTIAVQARDAAMQIGSRKLYEASVDDGRDPCTNWVDLQRTWLADLSRLEAEAKERELRATQVRWQKELAALPVDSPSMKPRDREAALAKRIRLDGLLRKVEADIAQAEGTANTDRTAG